MWKKDLQNFANKRNKNYHMSFAVKVGGGLNRKKIWTQTIGAMKQEAELMKNNFFWNWTLLQGPSGQFQPPGCSPCAHHRSKINFLKYGHIMYHFISNFM